jgi:hypothetical protein
MESQGQLFGKGKDSAEKQLKQKGLGVWLK